MNRDAVTRAGAVIVPNTVICDLESAITWLIARGESEVVSATDTIIVARITLVSLVSGLDAEKALSCIFIQDPLVARRRVATNFEPDLVSLLESHAGLFKRDDAIRPAQNIKVDRE